MFQKSVSSLSYISCVVSQKSKVIENCGLASHSPRSLLAGHLTCAMLLLTEGADINQRNVVRDSKSTTVPVVIFHSLASSDCNMSARD